MLRWMIYVIVVTLILSIAALSAERALRLRRASTRWVWLAAIVGSLVIPTVISFVSFQVPSIRTSPEPPRVIAFRDTTSLPLQAVTDLASVPSTWSTPATLDSQLERFWLLASGGLVLLLATSAVQLFWRKRHWARATVAGATVYTAPGVGPAVVGLLRPHIVVPPWVVQSSPACQALVIAHEQSHLAARDPLLLTTALCMLVFMPWNLPLWWAIRRLRHAIEVDCDARVLSAGHDADRYAGTLIDVGERQSSFLGSVAAMTESGSFLEQRIRIMLRKPADWWKTAAILLGSLSVCLIAVAAQVSPPNSGDSARRSVTSSEASDYDRYVGYYRFEGDGGVMVIKREGKRLLSRLLSQGPVEIVPGATAGEFFPVGVSARITFESGASGRATSMTLHQNGDRRALRMNDAVGKRLDDALTERIRTQTRDAGSEATLRRIFAAQLAGKPAYELMWPSLEEATHQQFESLSHSFRDFGPIQSVEFRGVGVNGWDVFYVKHEHALVTWRVFMFEGKAAGMFFHVGP